MGLFDALSNMFTRVRRVGMNDAVLTKDLDAIAEVPYENPSRFLAKSCHGDYEVYDRMMTDDDIKRSIKLKRTLALSTPWSVQPASDSAQDATIAEFVSASLNFIGDKSYNPSFRECLDNLLQATVYGFALGEKRFTVYDNTAPEILRGKIGVESIIFAHPRNFEFGYDEYRNFRDVLIGRYNANSERILAADVEKRFIMITYPYAINGNMYGESELDAVYARWKSKHANICNRDAYNKRAGLLLEAKLDVARNFDANAAAIRRLTNEKNITTIITPAVWNEKTESMVPEIEFISHTIGAASSGTYEASIEAESAAIRFTLLVPDRMGVSTSTSSGGYAESKTQADMFNHVLREYHVILEEAVQTLVDQIVELNFANAVPPKFKFADITDTINADALALYIDKGVISAHESWIRPRYGIPEISEEEQAQIDQATPAPMEQVVQAKAKNPFDRKTTERFLAAAEAEASEEYRQIRAEMNDAILKQLRAKQKDIVADRKKIESIAMPKSALKKMYERYYTKLAITGMGEAWLEIEPRVKKLGVKIKAAEGDITTDDWVNREWIDAYLQRYGVTLSPADKKYLTTLRDNAYLATGGEVARITKEFSQLIVSGLNSGVAYETIIAQVASALNEDVKKYATTVVRTSATDYYNAGRMNQFAKVADAIEAYMYNAIMDDATTPFCAGNDGRVILATDPALPSIVPPNHFNCRSTLEPIFFGEDALPANESYFNNWQNRLSPMVVNGDHTPAKGFGG